MGPAGMHRQLVRELDDAFVKPHSITFERLCQSGEVPEESKRVNDCPIFKKDKKEDTGQSILAQPLGRCRSN